MITEEDTFRALKRTPYPEMKRLGVHRTELFAYITKDKSAYYEFLEKHGWTEREIIEERDKNFQNKGFDKMLSKVLMRSRNGI